MDEPNMKHVAAILLLGLFVISTQTAAGTPVNIMTPAQIVEPFEEMMTGVYVATEWWNQSSDDWQYYNYEGTYDYYHYIEDASGNVYWIHEQNEYDIYDEWEFSNLLIVIILDPDASVMAWIANNQGTNPYSPYPGDTGTEPVDPINYTEPYGGTPVATINQVETTTVTDGESEQGYFDLWSLFWNPPLQAMTGDEVFVYSSFYFSYYYSDYYYETNFTWYDENMEEVNPNDVIPSLGEGYQWASWMNESWLYDEEWAYYGFGYDISEMTRVDDQVQWMNHYYSGMSAYNDSNSNGIMDIEYKEIEYDFDEDGVVDWTAYVVDSENSERLYDYYSDEATLGDVNLPTLNDNGQIEWSAEVVNIKGNFWEYTPWEVFGAEDALYIDDEYVEPTSIPAQVEYLEMVYRFEVTEDAAVVKIDQLIGDFSNPITGESVPELQGLGLTMNYWSSFSSYGIVPETSDGFFDYTGVEDAMPAPGGNLEFVQDTSDFMSISFGGTYVWGFDGGTYDVGTVILPNYYSCYPCLEGSYDSASVSSQDASWAYSTFYYSSCYSNWDGYEIIHDPVYAVYPMIAPGQVSGFMNNIVTASWTIGIIGIVAIATICVRNNKLRKMQ